MSKKHKKEKRAIKIAGTPPRAEQTAGFFSGLSATATGVDVNEQTALTCSAVFAAIDMISSSIASMPIEQFRRVDGGRELVENGRYVEMFCIQPNTEMTPPVFKETLQAHLLSHGNLFAEIEFTKGNDPLHLWPLAPHLTAPKRTKAGQLYYEVQNPDDPMHPAILLPEQVLHVPGLGYDGLVGYSVVKLARESLGLSIAAERYGAALFGNSARPGGILSTDKKLSDTAIMNLRQSWDAEHLGLSRAHRIAILQEGLKWQQMSLSAEDAQFLETRKFQVEEVARWFRMPPHLLRHLDKATFSNIEHQGQDYVTYTLLPWMVKWEAELNRKLLRPEERMSNYFKFDADALLRGDMLSRYKAYKDAREAGWVNGDEIRVKEDMNPMRSGQGKYYWMPQNYIAVEQLELAIKRGETGGQGGNQGDAGKRPAGDSGS